MTFVETFEIARDATPHLAQGFLVNLQVALGATFGGLALAYCILGFEKLGRVAKAISRCVDWFISHAPTFILLILFIGLLPKSVTLFGAEISIPAVPIAIAALAISGATYFAGILREIDTTCEVENSLKPEVLATAICNCALIMLMASGTVSYVGVPDVVARSIEVVNANGAEMSITIAVFGWVMLWFIMASTLTQRAVAFGLSRYRTSSRLALRQILRRGGARGRTMNPLGAMPAAPGSACDDIETPSDMTVRDLQELVESVHGPAVEGVSAEPEIAPVSAEKSRSAA